MSGRRIDNNLMNKKYLIGNSILWAAAIGASALLHAPVVLTILILPALFICSLVIGPKSAAGE